MIRRVHATSWKRHENASFEFGPGLNFVLGPNGSGKSSLLGAIKFGLLGQHDGSPQSCIRAGARIANVEVELDSGILVARSLDVHGGVEARDLSVDRHPGSASVSDMLLSHLGAEPLFLARLLFLSEGDIYREEHTAGLVGRQLQRLLPLESLASIRVAASEARKPIAKTVKHDRGELQASRDEVAQLTDEQNQLEASLRALTSELESARSALRTLRARAQEQEAAARRVDAFAAWRSRWERFCLESDLPVSDQPATALASFRRARDSKEGELQAARERRGKLSGRMESIRLFLDLLTTASEHECPLCKQPLDTAHRSRAIEEQELELNQLKDMSTSVDGDVAGLQQSIASLAEITSRCEQLLAEWPGELREPIEADPGLETAVYAAEEKVQAIQAELALRNQQLGSVGERLTLGQASLAREREITMAYRRDAQLEILASALADFDRTVQVSVLNPIADELQRQWKAYRADSEWTLTIDDEGRLCIRRGETILPYSALSGGEKMVSLMLLRVALARALTTTDFIVLDEPLEHLDPRTRRLLVSSLNQAVSKGILKQVIVSTYEESLARRLVLRSNATAIYVAPSAAAS